MTVSEAALMAERLPQGWDKIKIGNFIQERQLKVVVLKTLWYPEIIGALEASACEYLAAIGFSKDAIQVFEVPGSYELPLSAKWAYDGQLKGQKSLADIVITLGCVLQGDTPHFDFVCQACTQGLTSVQLAYGKPMGFGVLTVSSLEQATARLNKGAEAAQAAVFMALLNS